MSLLFIQVIMYKKLTIIYVKYSVQHGALSHTEQQTTKGPNMTSVKQFKQDNQRSRLYKKRETKTFMNNTIIW